MKRKKLWKLYLILLSFLMKHIDIKFAKKESINKGCSGERKYYVQTSDGKPMMMRLSDISDYDNKQKLFNIMKKVSEFGIPVPNPIDYGICEEGKSVCLLIEWCDGYDLEELLPSLPTVEQYKHGINTGKIFRKIHSIPAPEDAVGWHCRFTDEKYSQLREFFTYGIKINSSDEVLNYFETHKHLIKNRPLSFHHGDYHAGNLMTTESGEITVVDWDSYRYGDPWNDFMEIHNAKIYPHFLTGLLHGYFNGEPSPDFWPLLALYVSSAVLAAVCWAVNNSPDLVEQCVQNAKDAIQTFDNMKNPIPSWYIKG